MKRATCGVLFVVLAMPVAGQSAGRFEGRVVVEWLVNDSGPDRKMRLVEPFAFVDGNGDTWLAPEEAVVDGASIPRPLWSIIGSPFVSNLRRASVVHDYYCQVKTKPWQEVHRMFRDALIASGVQRFRAKVAYGAVRRFGPRWIPVERWRRGQPRFRTVIPEYSEADFRELEAWILENDPSLDDLDREVAGLLARRAVENAGR